MFLVKSATALLLILRILISLSVFCLGPLSSIEAFILFLIVIKQIIKGEDSRCSSTTRFHLGIEDAIRNSSVLLKCLLYFCSIKALTFDNSVTALANNFLSSNFTEVILTRKLGYCGAARPHQILKFYRIMS